MVAVGRRRGGCRGSSASAPPQHKLGSGRAGAYRHGAGSPRTADIWAISDPDTATDHPGIHRRGNRACITPTAADFRELLSCNGGRRSDVFRFRRPTGYGRPAGIDLGARQSCGGGIWWMPVCHGAGGMTAHRSFGARHRRCPDHAGQRVAGSRYWSRRQPHSTVKRFSAADPRRLARRCGVASYGPAIRTCRSRSTGRWPSQLVSLDSLSNLAIALIAALLVWWGTKAVAVLYAHR